MDQSSEPMTKLRKHGNVPDSEIGFNSQSAGSSFAQVEKSQLTSTSGRPNLIDVRRTKKIKKNNDISIYFNSLKSIKCSKSLD